MMHLIRKWNKQLCCNILLLAETHGKSIEDQCGAHIKMRRDGRNIKFWLIIFIPVILQVFLGLITEAYLKYTDTCNAKNYQANHSTGPELAGI